MRSTVFASAIALVISSGLAEVAAGGSPFAYVTNQGDDTVSVIDMSADAVVATVAVGAEPRWLQISDDFGYVYVSNHSSNDVSRIDTATLTEVTRIPVGAGPCWLEGDPEVTSFWSVANRDEGSVSFIDPSTDTVITTISLGMGAATNWGKPKASDFLATQLGRQTFIYLNQGLDNAAAIAVPLDGSPPFLERTIDTGTHSDPFWVDLLIYPDRTLSYITLSGTNEVFVYSYPSYQTVARIPVGSGPLWIKNAPDAVFGYVMNRSENSVSQISLAHNQVVATIPVGVSPGHPAITDDSSLVLVPNFADNTLSVIDVNSGTVVAVPVGENPTWVDISPDGSKAYVANKGSGDVSVIDIATLNVINTIPVGANPNMIVTRPHQEVHVNGK